MAAPGGNMDLANNINNGGGEAQAGGLAPPPAAPANARRDVNQHSTAQMFGDFPHESAIVMRRGIEIGVLCSYVLVAHCVLITVEHWHSEVEIDVLLRVFAVLRILCAMPRPYFWFHTRAEFIEARYQPTPQLVTRRLLAIYNRQSKVERVFFAFYYAWLLGIALVTLVIPTNPAMGYSAALWRHCVLNVISLIVHRLLCVSLFYYLMHCDLMRGIPREVVNKYTETFHWETSMRFTDQFMKWSSGKNSSSKTAAKSSPKKAEDAVEIEESAAGRDSSREDDGSGSPEEGGDTAVRRRLVENPASPQDNEQRGGSQASTNRREDDDETIVCTPVSPSTAEQARSKSKSKGSAKSSEETEDEDQAVQLRKEHPHQRLSDNFVPRRDATIGSCQEFSVDIKEVIEEILADTNTARDRPLWWRVPSAISNWVYGRQLTLLVAEAGEYNHTCTAEMMQQEVVTGPEMVAALQKASTSPCNTKEGK
eukprot:g13047.t1